MPSLEQPGHACIQLGCRAGYQRRHAKGHNDWLKIHGRITSPDGAWMFADPALGTAKMLDLIAWLRAGPDPAHPALSFTEPCLAFAMAPATSPAPAADGAILTITFRGEAAPPWLWGDDDAVWRNGYALELRVPSADIREFSEDLAVIGRER